MADEPDDDNDAFRSACAQHAKILTTQFDGVTVEVCIMATCGFLYHVWAGMLEERGIPFEDYITEIGTTLGGLHVRRIGMDRAIAKAVRAVGTTAH